MRLQHALQRRVLQAACGLLLLASIAGAHAEALKIGYLPVTGHAKWFIAKEQGFFAKEGLEVELIEFQNSADGLNAVVAGKLDLGSFGTTAPLAHIAKGADLRIIGGIMGEDAALITTADKADQIKTLADLKGKKIATVRLATGDAVLRGGLKDSGVDWKSEVQIFELKNPPAVIEAVKSGQVDAGVVWGPHDLRAEEQGLKVVVRSDAIQPGHPCCRIVVRGAQHPDEAILEKVLRAVLQAERFAAEHRRETIDAIARYVKLDKALIEKAYYQDHLEQASDPNVQGVERFWSIMQSSELVASKADITSYIDVTLYERALAGLAKENPDDPFWKKLQQQFKERNTL